MKKLNRFALLALIGGLLSSALVMGCGGGAEETGAEGGAGGNSAAGNSSGGTSPGASNAAQ